MTSQADPETFIFTAPDDHQIACYRWPVTSPRCVVQIVHGGSEHGARYAPLAAALNRAGYTVYASDHRGHGRTGEMNTRLGDMGPANAFERTCDDVIALGSRAKVECNGAPLVIIGHSLGSMITQRILLQNSEHYAAAVLSGSPDILTVAAGAELVHAEVDRVGRDQVSDVLESAILEGFSAAFPDAESPHAWLSRDPYQVQLYEQDPRCGFALCAGAWQDLIAAMLVTTEIPAMAATLRKNIPIYILSGTDDPVHGNWSAIERLERNYRECGVSDVTVRAYQGGRHESFNETNREVVVAELLDWLSARLP